MPVLSDVVKKIMYALAGVAALCAVLLALWVVSLRAENKRLGEAVREAQDALRVEQTLRQAERLSAQNHEKRLRVLIEKHGENHAKLQQAVQANAVWAAEPVPADVAGALGLQDSAD